MILDRLNLNQLRVFDEVFRSRSMTEAARKLHLTQSGVSQHVKALEDTLKVTLFDRLGRSLLPTRDAERLFACTSKYFEAMEVTLGEITGTERRLSGTISVGMPVEFGNNILIPRLSRFSEEHPGVQVAIHYGFASDLVRGLLNGELDFAFVDSFSSDERIETVPVYDEVLELCALAGKLPKSKVDFASVSYVDYGADAPVARKWLNHHCGRAPDPLRLRAWAMNAQGVAKMIASGMGAGVLPSHLVSELRAKGVRIHVLSGKKEPLRNSISLEFVKGRTHSAVAKAALEWLKKALRSPR